MSITDAVILLVLVYIGCTALIWVIAMAVAILDPQ